ncbi:calcium-dependent phosphoinositide phospholipase C [Mucilaginibacter yixingensis]|uniref:Calcium-dependent phosphoinositide phospholipase C n=1 Tax=Mucilaginibacter yixingensis TaxID=1295612 RepID=A0A2T5JG95_9SPHI|nr:phosphatidylinositol-specific phospholipase C1-like protein [Mucilaginibacter yixingensis]PTR01457.1 calcium-dependent phosphoinositide phospholipase C [Mucilaginibacter yixingensis]
MKLLLSALLLAAMPMLHADLGKDNTPINQIQVIGSHNSYKRAIDPALFKMMLANNPRVSALDYEHIPFADQLDMGLRNLEIDVYADSKGGKYAHPKGLDMVPNQAPYDPNGEMKEPGFKIFHVVGYDYRSNALTLKSALKQLKAWSEAHPGHNPIFITLEAKDGEARSKEDIAPEMMTDKLFADLDHDLLTYLGKQHIITPDDVRGKYQTLESAVTHSNWPTLKQARGKFLFLLDDHARKRDLYIAGHPSLKGRVMFACADPGTPEAGMTIRNNPKDPSIPELVKKGYIIRTRADADTKEARVNDRSGFVAACNSGAQIITTDYYLKSTHFKSDYVVFFETGDKYFRPNPLFTDK